MTNNTEVSLDDVIEAAESVGADVYQGIKSKAWRFYFTTEEILDFIKKFTTPQPATVQECETVYQHLDSKGTQYINGKGFVMELYWTDCTYKQYEKESNGNRRILYTHPPTTLTRERIVELIKQAQKEPDEELAADLIVAELSK